MRNTETGEFELVVGNRQLLSGFFIVILLLAVTFAMGYVVGQNSPRSAKVQAEAPPPLPVTSTADGRPAPSSPSNAPAQAAPAPSDSGTQPAEGTAPAQEPKGEQAAAEKPAPPPAAAPAASGAPVADPTPGSYWQVMAVRQPDAEVMVRTLKDMGLPAMMSPSPANPTLMRVLVGPYSDVESMGRVKSQLENVGLHPIRNNLK
jgi:cell division septation protein DedD